MNEGQCAYSLPEQHTQIHTSNNLTKMSN
uniref:Uncharacterized protein n=1 Tax=Rhizophora mucronata TaxID=61149 RepID=A0A2P2JGK9_RHIMU